MVTVNVVSAVDPSALVALTVIVQLVALVVDRGRVRNGDLSGEGVDHEGARAGLCQYAVRDGICGAISIRGRRRDLG